MNIWLIRPKMIPRPMDSYFKLCMSPPLALILIKQITPAKHKVNIIDYNFKVKHPKEKPDIVAISATVDTADIAIALAKEYKKMGAKTIVGGVHATCCPEYFYNDFDSICVGPAELIWERMLDDCETGNLKKKYEPLRPLAPVDIPITKIQKSEKRYLFNNIITASRGCNFRCNFCYNSASHQPLVSRNIADVIAEIKSLNIRHVLFVDDNFIANVKWTEEFLEELRKMNLIWSCAVSFNIINHVDLLDKMAESGCQSLFIGFETLNPTAMESISKGQNKIERYGELIDEIHKRNMMVNASIMLGMDGDTPETIDATIDWLIDKKVDTLTTHILTPYPGTALYNSMKDEGRLINAPISEYNTANVVFKPADISAEMLQKKYIAAYKKFYSLKNIIKRIPQGDSKHKIEYLLFNFLYRKFGKPISYIAYRLNLMPAVGRLAMRLAYRIKPSRNGMAK